MTLEESNEAGLRARGIPQTRGSARLFVFGMVKKINERDWKSF